MSGQLAQGAQQLLFMRLRDFLKVFQLLARLGFGLQLLELNAVVIPIEFFSQIADSPDQLALTRDRKSTRLNSSHGYISYAVFCLKKKNTHTTVSGPLD